MQNIAPLLMFDGKASEAIDLYISIFKQAHIVTITHYGANETGAEGKVKRATIVLKGQELLFIDSSVQHAFTFTPAMSLFVHCETEEEISTVFERLSDHGQVFMPLATYPFSKKFAWLSDKFGVSWQLSFSPS